MGAGSRTSMIIIGGLEHDERNLIYSTDSKLKALKEERKTNRQERCRKLKTGVIVKN